MELGLYSFAETPADHEAGDQHDAGKRLHDLLEEIDLADRLGLDVFGVGEHHRPDYAVSAPAVVLAAAAARTRRIRLTSAVSVISSDDPVRVFEEFATLDLLSNGRAEIMAGRGSFTESFPLFGYALDDYDSLFDEKLGLLLQLRERVKVKWSGRHRASIDDRGVYPRPQQQPLPVWIAVGGTPQSVVRAGTLGLPLAIAIIGGMPERFVPLANLYREAGRRAGQDPSKLKLSINSHGFVGESSQATADLVWPSYQSTMGRIGRERGWPPPTREAFDAQRGPEGALMIGDADAVAGKILFEHRLFGMNRFLLQASVGPMPHDAVMHAIELYATKVAPRVRKELGIRG